MAGITSLPEEVFFEIVKGRLHISDTFRLLQTCSSLYKYIDSKTLWLHIAACAQKLRPLPASPDTWRHLSVEELRRLSQRALSLNDAFGQDHLRGFNQTHSIPLDDIATAAGKMQRHDSVESAWLMLDGEHLLTLSGWGIMILWNLETREPLASANIEGSIMCWDHQADSDGVTVITNVLDGEDENEEPLPTMFRVWRFTWNTRCWKPIHQRRTVGYTESNYIRGNLAGCIGSVGEQYFVYAVDWTSQTEVLFDVKDLNRSLQRPPIRVSSLTSPTELFLFMDLGHEGRYHSFALDDIRASLQSPMLRGQITPHSSQIHMYDQERNSYVTRLMWLPRCRYLWDGRTGIFSRTWLGPCVCKLLVIDVATKDKASIETKVEDGVTYTVRHANQLLRRSIEEMSRLGGGGDVWTVGIFFKAMAWLEHAPSDDSPGRDGVKIRFVEFPPSTDRMPHSSATGSSFPGPADLDRKGGNAAQTVPITLDVEDLLDNGVLHPDSNDEFHRRLGEVVASNEHGHICEYELPPDWLARYKGTSSMDYDDARGRVAFVTGKRSERLIIYEIV